MVNGIARAVKGEAGGERGLVSLQKEEPHALGQPLLTLAPTAAVQRLVNRYRAC
jgi:hypothetical protein